MRAGHRRRQRIATEPSVVVGVSPTLTRIGRGEKEWWQAAKRAAKKHEQEVKRKSAKAVKS